MLIAQNELASQSRFVRFQAIHVGVHAGRRPAEHTGNARSLNAIAAYHKYNVGIVVARGNAHLARPCVRAHGSRQATTF